METLSKVQEDNINYTIQTSIAAITVRSQEDFDKKIHILKLLKKQLIDSLIIPQHPLSQEDFDEMTGVINQCRYTRLDPKEIPKKKMRRQFTWFKNYILSLYIHYPTSIEALKILAAEIMSEHIQHKDNVPEESEKHRIELEPFAQAIVDMEILESSKFKDFIDSANQQSELKEKWGADFNIEQFSTHPTIIKFIRQGKNFKNLFRRLSEWNMTFTEFLKFEKLISQENLKALRVRQMFVPNLLAEMGYHLSKKWSKSPVGPFLLSHPTIEEDFGALSTKQQIEFIITLLHPSVEPFILSKKIYYTQIIPFARPSLIAKTHEAFGNEKTIAIATIMEHALVKPYIDSNILYAYQIKEWGQDKTLAIAHYLSQEPASNFLQKGLLTTDAKDTLETIQQRVSLLEKYNDKLAPLFQDKIITPLDFKHNFRFDSEDIVFQQIQMIETHKKYFKLGLIGVFTLRNLASFDSQTSCQFQKLIDDLNQTPFRVLEFISRFKSDTFNFKIMMCLPEIRVHVFDALWHPEIQNILTNHPISIAQIIRVWRDEVQKTHLLMALSNETMLQEAQNIGKNSTWVFGRVYPKEILSILLCFGELMDLFLLQLLHYQLIPAQILKENLEWQPDIFLIYAKHKILLELQSLLNNPAFKPRTLFNFFKLTSIRNLEVALKPLAQLKLSILTYHHAPCEYKINVTFNKVLTILNQEENLYNQMPTNELKKLYRDTRDKFRLLKSIASSSPTLPQKEYYTTPETMGSITIEKTYPYFLKTPQTGSHVSAAYSFAKILMEEGKLEEAYHYLVKVPQSDPHYTDAMAKAAEIANQQKNYEDADYFLRKSKEIPKLDCSSDDAKLIKQGKTLLNTQETSNNQEIDTDDNNQRNQASKNESKKRKTLSETQCDNISDTLRTSIAAIYVHSVQELDKKIQLLKLLKEQLVDSLIIPENTLLEDRDEMRGTIDLLRKKPLDVEEISQEMANQATWLRNYLLSLYIHYPESLNDIKYIATEIMDERIQYFANIYQEEKGMELHLKSQDGFNIDKIIIEPFARVIGDMEAPESSKFTSFIIQIDIHSNILKDKWSDDFNTERFLTHPAIIQLVRQGKSFWDLFTDCAAWEITFKDFIKFAKLFSQENATVLHSQNMFTVPLFSKMGYELSKKWVESPVGPFLLTKSSFEKDFHTLSMEQQIELIETLIHPSVEPFILSDKVYYARIAPFTLSSSLVSPGWGKEKTIAIANIMLNPKVKPYVDNNTIAAHQIEKWGEEKTMAIVDYLSQTSALTLIEQGLLKIETEDTLDTLQPRILLLEKYKNKLESLLQEKIINPSDFKHYFRLDSDDIVSRQIQIIEATKKYFKIGFFTIFELSGFISNDPKIFNMYKNFIDYLNTIPFEILKFISAFQDDSFNLKLKMWYSDEREQIVDILWHPEIRDALTHKVLSLQEIIKISQDEAQKTNLLIALSNKAVFEKIQSIKNNHRLFKNTYENKILNVFLEFGQLMTRPPILQLLHYQLISIETLNQNWKPEIFLPHEKYKTLVELKYLVNKPEYKRMSLLNPFLPSGVEAFQKALIPLPLPSEISKDVFISHEFNYTINTIFYSVMNIFTQQEEIYNENCNDELKEAYHAAYQKLSLLKKIVCSVKNEEGELYTVAKTLLEEGKLEKAYPYLVKVPKTDLHYADAMFEAASIASAQGNHEDACYLFRKSHDALDALLKNAEIEFPTNQNEAKKIAELKERVEEVSELLKQSETVLTHKETSGDEGIDSEDNNQTSSLSM